MIDYKTLGEAIHCHATGSCDGCPYEHKRLACEGLDEAVVEAFEEMAADCEHYRLAADDWFEEACAYKEKLAKCKEELQRVKTTDTLYGYPLPTLIAFAAACRENGVEEKDLKTFANNVRFAFEIVHAEAEAAFQRAIHGVGGMGVK